MAERAALALPFPQRHRRKLPLTPGSSSRSQHQQSVPIATTSATELLPTYAEHSIEPNGASSASILPDIDYSDMQVQDGIDLDPDIREPIPLRHEETSFEGVSLEHLRQLEELQLQRQMLQLAEARLKASLCSADGIAPAGCNLPTYDQALTTPPPPPTATHAHGFNPGNQYRQEQTEYLQLTQQQQVEIDVSNADDLSTLLKASC